MKTNFALSLGLAAFMGLAAIVPASAGTTAATTAATTAGAAATTAAQPAATAAAPAKTATKKAAAVRYYVSLKTGGGCEVVTKKPDAKMLVGKHYYKTEAAAQKAMAADKACKA